MRHRTILPALLIASTSAVAFHVSVAEEALILGRALVTDGDTFNIGPVTVRLHGIDAPEAGQVCEDASGRTWPCGQTAIARLKELADGRELTCEARDRDPYRRVIAICSDGQVVLNEVMVSEGMAWAFRRYSDDYVHLEEQARAAGVGIWQGDAQTAWEFRENAWSAAVTPDSPRDGCPIKGNISSTGERIYHTPWSPWYARTRINTAAGERWFCDEAEAVAAGWRAAIWR